MNRKGVFFTLIAVFLIILIVSVISTRTTYRYREKSTAISARVRTMNNFIGDVEKDLDRALYIGAYRSILSMNSYIRETESYISDLDATFTEILVNGTLNNITLQLMRQSDGPDIYGADINSWLWRVNQEAADLNVVVHFFVNDINLTHTTPWDIVITMNSTLVLEDTAGIASWNITKLYEKDFSILGFEDPVYIVGTEDKVTNLINVTPYSTFIDDPSDNTLNLTMHYENSYYRSNTAAPSYLMRFSGDFASSEYGIESMVNLEDLLLQEQYDKLYPRSLIDYIYFGNQTTVDICNIQGMPPSFRIDTGHESVYEINEITNKTQPC